MAGLKLYKDDSEKPTGSGIKLYNPEPESSTWKAVKWASDKVNSLGEDWDWWKNYKNSEYMNKAEDDYNKLKRMDEPVSASRGWDLAMMGDQAPLSPRASAEFAGQFMGSPLAAAGTAATIASGGTSLAPRLASIGATTSKLSPIATKLAPLAAKAAPVVKNIAKGGNLVDRGISATTAAAQVPAFVEAAGKGDVTKALGTVAGIGLGGFGAMAPKTLPDVAQFPQGSSKSFTLKNPTERNLADLSRQGFEIGPVVKDKTGKPIGREIYGSDRFEDLEKLAEAVGPDVQGPSRKPATLATKVELPYGKTTTKTSKKLVKNELGQPVLDAKGEKVYEIVKRKVTDPTQFPEVFKKWTGDRKASDIESLNARKQFENLDDKPLFEMNSQGDRVVNDTNFTAAIKAAKPYFDEKYAQLIGSGKKLGFREDYIPQMWDNKANEIDAVFGPQSARLSLRKGFEFERILENYKMGLDKGLKPKFDKISDLVHFYDAQAGKAVADKNFFEYLKNSGLISTKQVKGREPLPESLFPIKRGEKGDVAHWNATPEVHDAITRFLAPDDPNTLQRIGRQLKTSALSAGLPGTGINFHGFSLAARNALFSPDKYTTFVDSIKSLAKPRIGAEYIEKNMARMPEAARDGLILGTEHVKYRGGAAPDKGSSGVLDKFLGWTEKTFEDPLFQKILPAMKMEKYDLLKADLIAKGMAPDLAGKTAATHANQIFGTVDFKSMVANDKFDKTMKSLLDKNGSWFLAPQWLASQGYIARDMAKALGNPNDPKGRIYHEAAKNLASVYTQANIANKVLSGHWMGENDQGKFFEIDTGQKDSEGKKIYIVPFGTGVDFARIPVEIATKIVEGDSQGLGNIVKSRLGPVQSIGLSAITGQNWRGKKLEGPADYAGLAKDYAPPYAKALINYGSGDQSALQSVTEGFELPVRFRKPEKKKRR